MQQYNRAHTFSHLHDNAKTAPSITLQVSLLSYHSHLRTLIRSIHPHLVSSHHQGIVKYPETLLRASPPIFPPLSQHLLRPRLLPVNRPGLSFRQLILY